MKISREIKTALLVITALVLLYFGISYLMSRSILSTDRVFYAEYNNVGGLVPSTKVLINGYKVGKVQDIQLQPSGKSLVTLAINHDFQFSKNSLLQLQESGFLGGKNLAILLKQDGAEMAVSGDTLKTETQLGMVDAFKNQLLPLQGKVEHMIVSADSLITSVNLILDTESRNNIKNGIKELNATIANFKKASGTLNTMLDSNKEKLDNTFTNVDNLTANLSKVSDSLAKLEINKTMKQLQSTIEGFDNIIAGIENGEGSVGKLLKDEELYNNLTGASLQMEQLLEDMKLNPKRYVHFSLFGKKAKQYEKAKEGEEENTPKKN
ncbi:MCE family protein [Kordia sp. YSTF-M3]|uniref:MCE family protein n=1 Tax=Kordia aestuariivivens TaxID=2759037 RepID=A0ABR7QDE3_9FLAO|nr:MlaD family protein [Kordia aestuariivivens]MBC8756443.1 MCE family protein [Kordia aestuariivivens]